MNKSKRLLEIISLLLVCIMLLTSCVPAAEEINDSLKDNTQIESDFNTEGGHIHEWTDWETTKESTCASEGEQSRFCSCGTIDTQPITSIEHNYESSVTPPTCISKGYTTHTCAVCNFSYTDSFINATGHDCDAVVISPTCEERGYTTYTCDCGAIFVEDYVDATGHSYGEWQTITETTCTDKGEQKRFCACGAVEAQTIPATGHNYESTVTPPTETSNGLIEYTCSACGDNYTDTITITSFTVTSKNRHQIGYTGIAGEQLVIPSIFEVDGKWYLVTKIDESAFLDCVNLISITVPSSVIQISSGAFQGCTSLEEITLPFVGRSKSYRTDDKQAFGYIFGYEEIAKTDTARTSDDKGYTYQLYYYSSNSYKYIGYYIPSSLRKVTITNDSEIPSNAFMNCDLLEVIVLQGDVTSIGSYAFRNCTGLTDIYTGMSSDNWKNLRFESNWNSNSYFYVHTNVSRYGLYFGVQSTYLDTAEGYVAIIPTDYTLDLKVYDTQTGQIIPIGDLGLKVDYSGALKSKNGTLYSDGGYGVLWIYQDTARALSEIEEALRICFIEREERPDEVGALLLPSEIEHASMCLDLFFSLYKVTDPLAYIDSLETGLLETYIYSFNSLSTILVSWIKFDSVETGELKRAFAKFIQSYVDKNTFHDQAVQETKTLKEMIEFAVDVKKNYSKWKTIIKIPDKITTLLDEIDNLYTALLVDGLLPTEITRLEELTGKFYDYFMNPEGIRNADLYLLAVKKNENLLSSYKTLKENYTAFGINNSAAVLNLVTTYDANMKVVWNAKPSGTDVAFMLFDAYLYLEKDYTANLQMLNLLRRCLLVSGYDENDLEVHIIDELISEYENEWFSATWNFLGTYITETITTIATKNPIMSVVSLATKLLNMAGQLDAKMEVYALEAYRDALHNCLSLIDNLYFTGELPSNLEEFKHIVSLYLGIMERSNELSIKVANSISNSIFPDYERDEDLAQLQEQLAFIRELQALYTN